MTPRKICVIGNGGFGTALALLLIRNGHDVILWGFDPGYIASMRKTRTNPDFLDGVELPEELQLTADPAEAASGRDFFVLAPPSKYYPSVVRLFAGLIQPDHDVASAAKGFDEDNLKRLSESAGEILGHPAVAAMSGPNHAEEVARSVPSACVAACADPARLERIQAAFMGPTFRVYTTPDVVGLEIGGALKNVIAVAAGISDGVGYGDNTKAALITRGLAEMTRLGVALGADPSTLSGLSGMGDLVVTCFSRHSRNRRTGEALGQGQSLADIQATTPMVAEGVWTCGSAKRLSEKLKIDLPITEQVYAILHHGKDPKEAVAELLSRDPRPENDLP